MIIIILYAIENLSNHGIQFEPEYIELGSLEVNHRVCKKIKIYNPANRQIELSSVHSTCGCTNVSCPKIIHPNSCSILWATFTFSKSGIIKSEIIVQTKNNKKYVLPVHGLSYKWYTVLPKSNILTSKFNTIRNYFYFRIIPIHGKTFIPTIKNISSAFGRINVQYSKIVFKDKNEYFCEASWISNLKGGGSYHDLLFINFTDPSYDSIELNAILRKPAVFRLEPEVILIKRDLTESASCKKMLCKTSNESGELIDVKLIGGKPSEWKHMIKKIHPK